jgi:hypothetical protein
VQPQETQKPCGRVTAARLFFFPAIKHALNIDVPLGVIETSQAKPHPSLELFTYNPHKSFALLGCLLA